MMTLHDPNHALAYFDRIVLMRRLPAEANRIGRVGNLALERSRSSRGNVVANGRPEEVMTPENIEAAYGMKVEIIEHKGQSIILPL